MKILIHRGTHTIGGSCIEIQSREHRIILDLGMPLMGRDGVEIDEKTIKAPSIGNGILPDVAGLYKDQTPSIDAVILSHPHIDHYGLADYIHPSIPIYLSKGVQTLIEVGNIFYPQKTTIQNCRNFEHWKQFSIGPFSVTSYLMDHAGFDASAFLIEADGKRIFYTGDFRAHGRKSKVFEHIINDPIKNVDCMIMEGTTLGGSHEGLNDEIDVEKKLYNIFTEQEDMSFVFASGSNIDRLISIYKAALKTGKILVFDLYTVYLLDQLKKNWPSLPPHQDDNIKVYYIKAHADAIVEKMGKNFLYEYKDRKIEIADIVNDRRQMVLRLPISAMQRIAQNAVMGNPLDKAVFLYSMWSGYLEKNPSINRFCNQYNIPIIKVHTSGHAYLNDLKRLMEALKPKALIPIHTLSGDDFVNHFDNVVRIDDGTPFEVK